MPILQRLLDMNRASNRIFYQISKRDHYMAVYARLLGEAATTAQTIIHLGSGPLGFAEVCKVPLEGKTIWAVDPDEAALSRNPSPNRLCASGEAIPLPDACVDLIASEHLLEHVEDIQGLLRESHRLLRPGGRFVFTTPNFLSYSGMATHFTPFAAHRLVMHMLNRADAASRQPYPTFFRFNTVWRIEKLARAAQFDVAQLWTGVDHPTYTSPIPVLHQAAVLTHLVLDKVEVLAPFRLTLTGVLVKK